MNSRLENFYVGGDGGIRTLDPQIANLMLSQLSYVPNERDYKLVARCCQEKFFATVSAAATAMQEIFSD